MKCLVPIALVVLGGFAAPVVTARELSPREGYRLVERLDSAGAEVREAAKRRLIEAGDRSLAAALVEMIFFSPNGRADAIEILEHLLGEPSSSATHPYKRWFEEIGRREEIQPKPGYVSFKAKLYARIDPAFAEFLREEHPRRIRIEEVIFGGVVKDGIPALDNPRHVPAEDAGWLGEEEIVFGVALGGEARAYPRRILDWHEMANDEIGGHAVSLSWCTLCGSAILYETTVGGETFTFGTSGLLYRSNKLMYDRRTGSLWSQMTGSPVIGPLARSEIRLKSLPLVRTTWREWLSRHPDTRVISTRTGFDRDYRRLPYDEYFASDRLMFPVWKQRDDLPEKEWVWTLDLDGVRKAYRLEDLRRRPLLADRIGERDIVLITDSSGGVRTYESARDVRFILLDDDAVVTDSGRRYSITEAALLGEEGERLARLPGHTAFWFGWYAFHPDTILYAPEEPGRE